MSFRLTLDEYGTVRVEETSLLVGYANHDSMRDETIIEFEEGWELVKIPDEDG